MKIPIRQIEESINPTWRAISDIERIEKRPGASRHFERRLCWILVTLIFAVIVLVFFVATSIS